MERNRRNYRILQLSLMIAAVLMTSCDGLSGIKQPEVQAAQTFAAQTISADRTLKAPTSTSTITRTPRPPRPSLTPTQTSTITATTTPQALLIDDFSTISGWGINTTDDFSYGYAEGGYRISVDIPFTTVWSTRQTDLANIRLEVIAKQVAGPQNGFYGLTCRQQVDGFNYYVFVINPDGFYAIGKVVEGTLEFIKQNTDNKNIIQTGVAANKLRADCFDHNLSLYVNGQKLLEVQDDTYKTGFFGLVAGIHGMGTDLNVLFDDFFASQPEDAQ